MDRPNSWSYKSFTGRISGEGYNPQDEGNNGGGVSGGGNGIMY